MSINQFDSLKAPHRPIHAFYAPPPAGFVLTTNINDNKEPKSGIATTTATSIKPTSTMTDPKLKPPVVNEVNRPPVSILSTIPSSIPINRNPPLVVTQQNDPTFNSKTPMERENKDHIPWLAPFLGVLGVLGVVAICILYFLRRNRKKRAIKQFNESYHHDRSISEARHQPRKVEQLKAMPKGYQSWASLSTINTTLEQQSHEKNMICQAPNHALPPPAYTSIRQKRMTADTLVDENNISILLKSQYAPQLAFSPSLVAGEFQLQQQLQNEDRPPLPTTISPSNTLIDNAGVLSSTQKVEHYHYSFDQRPKKIEIYEPQVNLDDPFIPYSYSNDEDEENEEEEEKEEERKRNGKRDDIV